MTNGCVQVSEMVGQGEWLSERWGRRAEGGAERQGGGRAAAAGPARYFHSLTSLLRTPIFISTRF